MARRSANYPDRDPQERMVPTVDEARIPPASDVAQAKLDPHPHACVDGFVFLTYDVDGEEVTEAIPCRRCAEEAEDA
jgi:hypothetical protein